MPVILTAKQQAYIDKLAQSRTKASKGPYMVNISTLPAPKKREIWQGIQTHNPALANLFANDANIKTLQSNFGASVMMTEQDIEQYSK